MYAQNMRNVYFEYRSNIIKRTQRIKTQAFYEELFVFILRNTTTENNNGIFVEYSANTPSKNVF